MYSFLSTLFTAILGGVIALALWTHWYKPTLLASHEQSHPAVAVASKRRKPIKGARTIVGSQEIYAVFLGETGAGKSSLINLLNFWGKGETDLCKAASILTLSNESGKQNQTASQTKKPQKYDFPNVIGSDGQSYNLHLIDTPGMGDTCGIAQDDDGVKEILKFLARLPALHAIVLVINGSNARVSSRTKYILQRLSSMCPASYSAHMYLLLTNTQLDPNFNVKVIPVDIPPKHIFPLDNLLFSALPMPFEKLSSPQQKKIALNYEECQELLSAMFTQWCDEGSLDTKEFMVLFDTKDELQLVIKEIVAQTTRLEILSKQQDKVRRELTHTKPSLDRLRQIAGEVITMPGPPDKIETPYHSTVCITCHSVCHEQCNLEQTVNIGADIFKGCAAMRQVDEDTFVCKECTHGFRSHVHGMYKFIPKTMEFKRMSSEEEEELNKLEDRAKFTAALLKNHDEEAANIEDSKQANKARLDSALAQLKKVCPAYDPYEEIVAAVEMLNDELRIATLDPEQREAMEKTRDDFRRMTKNYMTAGVVSKLSVHA
jgi:GTP-binding protein EngB required for normal cell division